MRIKEVKNVSFSENFLYVLNEWSLSGDPNQFNFKDTDSRFLPENLNKQVAMHSCILIIKKFVTMFLRASWHNLSP